MCSAVLRRGLSERTVYRAGGVLRVLQMVGVRVVCVRMVRVRRMAVLRPRWLRVAGAQVRRAAMVLGQRQRRARRPPVAALLHIRRGRTSRRPAARAPPAARQRMPPRLVRAPIVALAARHPCPSLSPRAPLRALASPPSGRHRTAHPFIRNN